MQQPDMDHATNTSDKKIEPYIPATESPLEFSMKAVVAGVLFGICFGAANAYLGLQAGLTLPEQGHARRVGVPSRGQRQSLVVDEPVVGELVEVSHGTLPVDAK